MLFWHISMRDFEIVVVNKQCVVRSDLSQLTKCKPSKEKQSQLVILLEGAYFSQLTTILIRDLMNNHTKGEDD